jgi:hypothetical protein
MKRFSLVGSVAISVCLLTGCESAPSGQWVRPDTTDAQAKTDYDTCSNRAISLSEGQHSVSPFSESLNTRGCMERQGYHFVPAQAASPGQGKRDRGADGGVGY